MSEATLNVDKIAFCSLEIQGTKFPKAKNLVADIKMSEGFGISIPTLQLTLNDEGSQLSSDLNLMDGTKITIKLGKKREDVKKRDFRVFSYKKQTTSTGNQLVINCILDIPKWGTGVFTESFEGTSGDAISGMGGKAGLKYSGPKSTPDDKMIWLNVNKTRSSAAEDIAMRGWVKEGSCMARIVTLDKDLLYKELFEIFDDTPKFSFLMNTSPDSAKGKPVVARESQDASSAGFSTNMVNYGMIQYQHNLDIEGQKELKEVQAKVLGDGLPINDEVKGDVSDRKARVVYTGWDSGTKDKDDSNLHKEYEKAFYQNFKLLGLFSERVIVLTDTYTDAKSFDLAEYLQSDFKGKEFKPLKSLSGKWLIGGKTIWIQGGHRYCEVFYLYRPFVQEKKG